MPYYKLIPLVTEPYFDAPGQYFITATSIFILSYPKMKEGEKKTLICIMYHVFQL